MERTLLWAGLVTMAFGLLALLGWGFGWPLLASFGANRMPMAPSTAVLFLLYGAAICLRARTPLSRPAQWSGGVLVGLGTVVTLVFLALGWLGIQWTGEHLGLNITGSVDGTPIGHMSPVTAFCFLLAGASFLASLSPSATQPRRAAFALVLAALLLGICFVFLVAYGFGTPLLYDGQFIPPALNTILAFITLGLALMALAGHPGGRFRGGPGDGSKQVFFFVLLFFLLAIGIVVTGYAYYRNIERKLRAQAEQQLATIAELKVGELVQWRKERLGTAAVFFDNPSFAALVRRFFLKPEDANAQRQIQNWLAKEQLVETSDRVRLLDAQGLTRLALPAGGAPISSAIARSASEALQTGQIRFQDFYRNEHDQRVYMAILVPLRDETNGNRPLGVLVLGIDPSTYLYPLIRRWPVPSETAETLLVRREGNEVVFLNELRFQKNTALNLRRPLANTDMPAVKAALGQEGVVEGRDYRGVPALAELRAVPDSPWFMVARRDLAEVYAPLRAELLQVLALVGVLLFGAGAGVALVWRQQHARIYRERAEVGEALQRYQALLANAEKIGRVGGWEIDVQSRQTTWTETVYDIYELDGSDRLTVDQGINYYTPASRPIIEQAVQRTIEQGEPFDLELEIVTAKGNRRHVHAVGKPDLPRGKVSGFFQDITERKQAEEVLKRTHDTLVQAQKIAHLGSFEYIAATRTTVWSEEEYRIYGLDPTKPSPAYEEMLTKCIHPDDAAFLHESFTKAVQSHSMYELEHRIVRPDGSVRWVYDLGHPYFDEQGELVRYVGTTLDITERKRAEELLRTSQEELLLATEGAKLGVWNWNIVTGELIWSARCKALFGIRPDEAMSYQRFLEVLHPDDRDKTDMAVKAALDNHKDYDIEYRSLWPDGSLHWLEAKGRGYYDATGRATRMEGVVWDITDRKRIETERQKFFLLAESSSEFIGMCDLDMNPLYVNPAGQRLVGLPDMAAACQVKVHDYYFPEDQRFVGEEFFPRVLREGHGDVEIRLRHFQTGEPIWMFYYLFSVHDAGGSPVGWATVSRDITARRQAEEALRQSRTAALNLMRDAVEARDRSEQASEALRASERAIREQLDELRRWHAVMLGTADRAMKLKREVNELARRLGEPIRYPSQEE